MRVRAKEQKTETIYSGSFKRPDILLRLTLEKVLVQFRGGIHRSVKEGLGIELKSFKPYDPSDPLRSIDAFVSARVSENPEIEPISRVYYQQKEIATVVLLDVGDSMTIPPRKEEHAAKILWLFALSTLRYGDRFRIIPFEQSAVFDSLWIGDENTAEQFIENIGTSRGLFHRVRGVADAFSYLTQLSLRDTIIVIISDFCMKWETRLSSLKQLGVHEHNIRFVLLALDEWDGFVPQKYGMRVYDPLTHKSRMVSMDSHGDMARRAEMARRHVSEIADSIRPLGAPLISISLLSDPLATVAKAFLKLGWV